MFVWSLPRVFHTCGKNCGNSNRSVAHRGFRLIFVRFLNEMNLWDQILSRVEAKVNRHSFYTWFKPTSFVSEDAAAMTVRVPNLLFKDWLTKHYSGVIAEAMAEVRKGHLPVNFVAELRTTRQASR